MRDISKPILIRKTNANTAYTVLRLDIVLVNCAATPKSPVNIHYITDSRNRMLNLYIQSPN